MTDAIQPVSTSTPSQATNALWVADDQLDAQEVYNAEKQAEKYHEYLSETAADELRGPVKDKMARLALIVAQKNLSI